MNDAGAKVTREEVSQRILAQAAELAELAEKLDARSGGKLEPIASIPPATPEKEKTQAPPMPCYPPLFHELRGYFQRIENSLNSIKSTIDRVELP